LIQYVLESDLLIQAGRTNELRPMKRMEKVAVLAFRKAQNRVEADRYEEHQAEMQKK